MSSWRKDLLGLGFMAGGSLCIGLTINGLRQNRLPLVYVPPPERLIHAVALFSPSPLTPGQWRSIELDELQELVSAHRSVTIDARASSFYQAGHIPGAIPLPREDFERVYPKVRALIELSRDQEVVVYCSEADCQDSELVADALSRLGYRHLRVYKEGWEEWSRAGLPQTQGQTP